MDGKSEEFTFIAFAGQHTYDWLYGGKGEDAEIMKIEWMKKKIV